MKNVEKYFSLKLSHQDSFHSHYSNNNNNYHSKKYHDKNKNINSNNTGVNRKRQIPNHTAATSVNNSLSKSNEDLLNLEDTLDDGLGEPEFEQEESLEPGEEARLAEEALAANLKLIKKQKAKFIRLQRILSRNVFFIPMCIIFTFLSGLTIYSSTLTDYYETISYNATYLRHRIRSENNQSLLRLNSYTSSNLSLVDIYKRATLEEEYWLRITDDDSLSGTINNKKQTLRLSVAALNEPTFVFYDLIESKKDYLIVKRIKVSSNYTLVKYNYLYETHSGVWRTCNNLSSKYKT